jgi:hypothetical protein
LLHSHHCFSLLTAAMSGTTQQERDQMAQQLYGKSFDECDSMERVHVGQKLGGARISEMAAEQRGEGGMETKSMGTEMAAEQHSEGGMETKSMGTKGQTGTGTGTKGQTGGMKGTGGREQEQF